MNMLQTFTRILTYGINGFRRNIWISVISVITMTLVLMTVTVFAMGNLIAKERYRSFNDKIDYIVFIKDEASDADIQLFTTQVSSRAEISTAKYVSKEDARVTFETDFSDISDLRGLISEDRNPLPRSVTVKFSNLQQIDAFDTFVSEDRFKSIVYTTSYIGNRVNIDNYLRTANFVKIIGISFTASFILVALVMILNTIRLAIHARREEVEIMRLVGASPWFIRWPFFIEGLFYGVIGAVASGLLTWALLVQTQKIVSTSFSLGGNSELTELFGANLGLTSSTAVTGLVGYFFLIQIVTGVLLGVFCSWYAVRRYLKEI